MAVNVCRHEAQRKRARRHICPEQRVGGVGHDAERNAIFKELDLADRFFNRGDRCRDGKVHPGCEDRKIRRTGNPKIGQNQLKLDV